MIYEIDNANSQGLKFSENQNAEFDALLQNYDPSCTSEAYAIDFEEVKNVYQATDVSRPKDWIELALYWTAFEAFVALVMVIIFRKNISNCCKETCNETV